MKVFCIDFETYYSQTYSLTKLTTEEYIRGAEFEAIGFAIQEGDGEPIWYSGTKQYLKNVLDSYQLDQHLVVAHNAMFDMAILSFVFDVYPKAIADTLSMARAIHGTEVDRKSTRLNSSH